MSHTAEGPNLFTCSQQQCAFKRKEAIMKPRIRTALFIDKPLLDRTISTQDMQFLKSFADIINEDDFPQSITKEYMKKYLPQAQACFSCWGTPAYDEELLAIAPGVKLLLHTAGTPKSIVTDAVWERNIRVITSAPAIAIDVAESALGGIIYWLKQFSAFDTIVREGKWNSEYDGVSDSVVNNMKPRMRRLNSLLTVGIISASHVGQHMIRLLKPFGVNIMLYDPTLSSDEIIALGANPSTLQKIASLCDIVSIHAPSLPETENLIDGHFIQSLKDECIFVNTSRGSIVDETALIDELKTGRFYAYLDVFEEEPLSPNSPLLDLKNVLLTPHISGGHTVNGGFERGRYAIDQLYTYHTRGTLTNESFPEMLDTMA